MDTIESIAQRSGVDKEDVLKDYNMLVELVRNTTPTASEADIKTRAEIRLTSMYKKMIVTGALDWTGYIVRTDDASDRMDNKRKHAEQTWKTDKQRAIDEGLTDSSGVVLECKKENKSYGQPLRPFIAKTLHGVASAKGRPPKKFNLLFTSDDVSKIPCPPMHKTVKFKARLKEDTADEYILANVANTKFEDALDEKIPAFDSIVSKTYKPLKNLNTAVKHQDIILECIIDSLDIENSFNMKRMNVSLEKSGIDSPTILVYMPRTFRFGDVEGLGEQTKAILWGRFGGPKEDGTIVINGDGLWIYPDWRTVKPPEIKKEDVVNKNAW
jgi:hypothetical protein